MNFFENENVEASRQNKIQNKNNISQSKKIQQKMFFDFGFFWQKNNQKSLKMEKINKIQTVR